VKRARFNGLQGFAVGLLVFVTVCGILYWGSTVLIPVALAILLSLILNPAVRRLQRWRLPKLAAVMVVVSLVAAAIGALLWAVTSQVASLAKDIPEYRGTIKAKWADVRGVGKGGSIEKIQTTLKEVSNRELMK
jgi:predicted PurR-regulated permease PerM